MHLRAGTSCAYRLIAQKTAVKKRKIISSRLLWLQTNRMPGGRPARNKDYSDPSASSQDQADRRAGSQDHTQNGKYPCADSAACGKFNALVVPYTDLPCAGLLAGHPVFITVPRDFGNGSGLHRFDFRACHSYPDRGFRAAVSFGRSGLDQSLLSGLKASESKNSV